MESVRLIFPGEFSSTNKNTLRNPTPQSISQEHSSSCALIHLSLSGACLSGSRTLTRGQQRLQRPWANLDHFEKWCTWASALASFLSHKWSCEHFCAKCLNSPLGEVWRSSFESFKSTLVDWRFNSAFDVADSLLTLQLPLQTFWKSEVLDDEIATQAVRSPWFWLTRVLFTRLKRF